MKLINGFVIISITWLLFNVQNASSQPDTINNHIFDVAIETGTYFPQSKHFYDIYKSKSGFYWSLGFKSGKSEWKILPWLKYSQFQMKIDSMISTQPYAHKTELIAKKRQIAVGFVNPILIKNNNYLQFKYGGTYNFMSERLTNLENESIGFVMSIGYMKKLSDLVSYHFDLNYDFANTPPDRRFKEWSGLIINFGLNINFSNAESDY